MSDYTVREALWINEAVWKNVHCTVNSSIGNTVCHRITGTVKYSKWPPSKENTYAVWWNVRSSVADAVKYYFNKNEY